MNNETLIGRRGFFRLGAFAALATAASSLITTDLAFAKVPSPVCNPEAPTNPADALAALVQGNANWAAGNQEHPGEDSMRRSCLATSQQTPFASILSCSDSRCPPELLFDQGLGDIFVARVAGNTASGRLVDSLLYGTDVLGTQLLFVLGHSACGAVAAAVSSYPRPNPTLPFVDLIFPAVAQAKFIVRRNHGNPNDPAQVIPVATNQNVVLTMKELKRYFGLSSSEVSGGVYDLGTQLVTLAKDLSI
jgi:carbonic anhydrase